MRILPLLVIISLSQFCLGQNVFTTFLDTLVYDDFTTDRNNFPQKYNASEISMLEDGLYRIKRLDKDGQSVKYYKTDQPLVSYQISADFTLTKFNKKGTAGLILHGQTLTNGGIFIELSSKKKYRAYKINGTQQGLLSGSPQNNGWIKSKNLTSKKNTITVSVEQGYFDIYFNGQYTYTIYDTQFDRGKVGIFSGPRTEVLIDQFSIKKSGKNLAQLATGNKLGMQTPVEPAFEEVILIFKTKIDLQQKEIANLEKQVNKCKSMLNYDTTLITKNIELIKNNQRITHQLDSTTKALSTATKRLNYLESIKEDIEEGANGDLVMNLTTILAGIKRENMSLKTTNTTLAEINTQLKKDNAVLLREIERIKSLLESR